MLTSFTKGQRVRVASDALHIDSQANPASLILVSANSRALAVEFAGPVYIRLPGGSAAVTSVFAVSQENDGSFHDMFGNVWSIEPLGEP